MGIASGASLDSQPTKPARRTRATKDEGIMASLENQVTRLQVITETLTSRFEDATRATENLLNEIRGHNGDPGLIGRVILVERQMGTLNEQVSNLSEEVRRLAVAPHICQYEAQIKQLSVKPQEAQGKVDENTVVTWVWIRDKILLPVFLAAITFMLFNFIPQLFGHLAAVGK